MSDSPVNAEDFYEFANQFLNENIHLFTIIGIFGAIAVYLGRLTTELSTRYVETALDIGVFSSLSLFVLIGAMLGRRYYREYSDFSDIPLFYPRKKSVVPGLSLIFFIALIGAVSIIVMVTLWESWFRFLLIIIPLLFTYAFTTINTYVPDIIDESDRLSWIPYVIAIFLFCMVILLIMGLPYVFYRLFIANSADIAQNLIDILTISILVYLIIMACLIPLVYRNVE